MIEFDAVSKKFRDGTSAVADLSLTAPSNKITVIVGPSGCGKTTALQMINRMIEPSSGKISWDGSPVRSRRRTALRRQMGYLSQRGGLFPHRTVVENIATVPDLLGWSKDKAKKRSYALLDRVGLDPKLAYRYPAELTASESQRVAIARALAGDPDVLLMDEPFAAADSLVRGQLHEFLLGLQRQTSKTIVLTTQDIDEALKLGDHVAILRPGGRLAQAGAPAQLLDKPADAFVDRFLGRDRGYRALSTRPASALTLERVKVVRDAEGVTGSEPTLIVDGGARPLGWADREGRGPVLPLGPTFHRETDTLQVVLGCALTSPYGLAVAVAPDTGRFAGVVSTASILEQIKDTRLAAPESTSIQDDAEQRSDVAAAEVAPTPDAPDVKPAPSDESTVIRPAAATETAAPVEDVPSREETPPPDDRVLVQDQAEDTPGPAAESAAPVADPTEPAATDRGDESGAADPEVPAVAPADELGVTTVVSGKWVDSAESDVRIRYSYDQREGATRGGHVGSADDVAGADEPDDRDEIDLDALDLEFIDDRDPVR